MSLCYKPMATHGGGLLTLTQPLACPCTPAPQQAQAQPLVTQPPANSSLLPESSYTPKMADPCLSPHQNLPGGCLNPTDLHPADSLGQMAALPATCPPALLPSSGAPGVSASGDHPRGCCCSSAQFPGSCHHAESPSV